MSLSFILSYQVLIGERESRPSDFDDKSPIITDVTVEIEPKDGSVLLSSDGGKRIEVVGRYFGVEPKVAIGGSFCKVGGWLCATLTPTLTLTLTPLLFDPKPNPFFFLIRTPTPTL
jgi:hypothetical protein